MVWLTEILWKVNVLKMSNLRLAGSVTDWTDERLQSLERDSFTPSSVSGFDVLILILSVSFLTSHLS